MLKNIIHSKSEVIQSMRKGTLQVIVLCCRSLRHILFSMKLQSTLFEVHRLKEHVHHCQSLRQSLHVTVIFVEDVTQTSAKAAQVLC